MYRANEIYVTNLIHLINTPYNTKNQKVRPVYKDGTPAHTNFITNVCDTYNIAKGEFPITNFRPVAWQSAIKEILWIYQDQSNDLELLRYKYRIRWWDEWEVKNSSNRPNIGLRYGATIKKYNLMNNLLDGLKNEPYSRRHIINMYQYADFKESEGLNPCVYETVWNVRGEFLDVFVNQRSSDYVTSECINRLQYCALLMMVAKAVGLKPGLLTYNVCNLHIYDRHIEQANILLNRIPSDKQPKLILDTDKTDFYSFTINDFKLEDFVCEHDQLKFELAI